MIKGKKTNKKANFCSDMSSLDIDDSLLDSTQFHSGTRKKESKLITGRNGNQDFKTITINSNASRGLNSLIDTQRFIKTENG